MTPNRRERFQQVAERRQFDLTVILENVHDTHNIGAVLRTCDSVGINEVFILTTEPHLQQHYLTLGKRTSSGARRWIEVHYYHEREACFAHVKKQFGKILSTHLSEDATDLYELNLSEPVALLFGNEHDGVSQESLAFSDGNFIIPQMGMVQSLNISVACAVSLYEAYRQRAEKGYYRDALQAAETKRKALFQRFVAIHEGKEKGRKVWKKGGDRSDRSQ